MRAFRLLALAAALVVPAAAAHAQVGVYVGPSVRYAAPVYGVGYAPGYDARYHWDHRRAYVGGPWIAPRAYPGYGFRHDWRRDRVWVHDGRYARGGRW
jgi:hypothetical protein